MVLMLTASARGVFASRHLSGESAAAGVAIPSRDQSR
jgi:hypothetical protein